MSKIIQILENFNIYNVSAYITSSISISLNTILITIIIKKTPKEMKSFKNVLLQTCLVDIIFATVSCLAVPHAETSDYKLFFRSSSSWLPSTGIFPCLSLWIYVWALLALLWSMIIQALFRYFIIIKRITPNSIKTWILQGIIFLVGMVISLPNLCVPCQNTSPPTNKALVSMGLWKNYPNLHRSFRSVFYREICFILYACLILGLTLAANAIYFISTWKVKAYLNSSKIHFSAQTIKIHKQFERKLILQSIMPCFSFLSLIAIFLYIFALPVEYANVQGGMLLLALMPLQYIIVFNPLITLWSIKSYRNAIFCRPKKVTLAAVAGIHAATNIRISSKCVH